MNYSAPRGTHDVWGTDAAVLYLLESTAREIFSRYGFSEVRFPTFEDAALFTRSIGEATDIVEKEMYVFKDRKGRSLALRPEGTASVVRLFVEHALDKHDPVNKYFYCGSMFRYERPQAGRYREFYQIGAEHFGSEHPAADAEMILLARDLLAAAGVEDMHMHLHTIGCAACRPAFRAALLSYLDGKEGQLCADCTRRKATNPLRVLDCKIDGPRLSDHPKMESYLCPACAAHFSRVQSLLTAAGCDYIVDPRLVRGLDYYTRTIFEVRSGALGSQDALAAGGRYDTLVAEIGGPPSPAVGFALGSERVVLAAKALIEKLEAVRKKLIFIAVAGPVLEDEACKFVAALRGIGGARIEGPYAGKSLKSQMKLADKLGAATVIIFGEEEFKRGCVTVRDMESQRQREASLAAILAGGGAL